MSPLSGNGTSRSSSDRFKRSLNYPNDRERTFTIDTRAVVDEWNSVESEAMNRVQFRRTAITKRSSRERRERRSIGPLFSLLLPAFLCFLSSFRAVRPHLIVIIVIIDTETLYPLSVSVLVVTQATRLRREVATFLPPLRSRGFFVPEAF